MHLGQEMNVVEHGLAHAPVLQSKDERLEIIELRQIFRGPAEIAKLEILLPLRKVGVGREQTVPRIADDRKTESTAEALRIRRIIAR
jgi:hypothetical protein